ncbi:MULTISPECIES: hypothetical protein [unclassified Pseudomonas]|uniref:hypothetical protein n=1 Tax=unclassified Pseudomonas TaxID=196821 RepID=UPI0015A344A4|nr:MULTISPECIES: hypothetical protein [unclassified Pseudomonas]NWC93040.1 hypothetical protein [Pseudomonas sp. IPO3779]NWD19458.1 hypothetical protein [Pseudomonas sp. IPO3778]
MNASEKNKTRILIVDNWPFQLMNTLIRLGDAGYFNTYPALNCLEALIELHDTLRPYDIVLCSTSLEIGELRSLLQEVSRHSLARYFSLAGDVDAIQNHMGFLTSLKGPGFQFLGVVDKPLVPSECDQVLGQAQPFKRSRGRPPLRKGRRLSQ